MSGPFSCRVRVLIDVSADTDEIELVTATFERIGCNVRSARPGETPGFPAPDRACAPAL
jgi:hypothetical protein